MKRKLQSIILTAMFAFSVAGAAVSIDGSEYSFKGDCFGAGCHCHYFHSRPGSTTICTCGHSDYLHEK